MFRKRRVRAWARVIRRARASLLPASQAAFRSASWSKSGRRSGCTTTLSCFFMISLTFFAGSWKNDGTYSSPASDSRRVAADLFDAWRGVAVTSARRTG